MDLAVVAVVVGLALAFAWTNGFLDAANAIATSITTRALTPAVAVAMAAVLSFLGGFLGQRVAETVGSVITPAAAGPAGLLVVVCGLLGAIVWNLAAWWLSLPSSSTLALIGGLLGAGLASGSTVRWSILWSRVVVPMLASPLLALVAAFALMLLLAWVFRGRPARRARRGFRLGQTVSAAAVALGHGLQDAQKTMGVILLALVTGGHVAGGDPLPWWVVVSASGALAAGTWAGGWRVVRALGRRVVDLDPPQGFAAESAAAGVLFSTAYVLGAPTSSTHTVSAAVVGAGATRSLSAVRWGIVRRILLAWVLTVPASAALAACCHLAGAAAFRLP